MTNLPQGKPIDLQARGNQILADMWRDLRKRENDREAEAAKRDPAKYRLSKVIEGGLQYKYYEERNGNGSRVRFCYSVNRNVAGYFLVWREVLTERKLVRDQWDSCGSKDGAIRTARTMWERYKT